MSAHLIKEVNQEEIPLTPQAGHIANAQTPRQRGENLRAQGLNPRALGTNPRAVDAIAGSCRSCHGKGKVYIAAIGLSDCTPCRGTGQQERRSA